MIVADVLEIVCHPLPPSSSFILSNTRVFCLFPHKNDRNSTMLQRDQLLRWRDGRRVACPRLKRPNYLLHIWIIFRCTHLLMGKNYLVLLPNCRDTNGPSDSTSEGRRFAGRDLTPPKTTTLKSPNTLTAVSLTPPSLRPSPLAALSSTSPAAAATAAVTPSAAAAPSLATAAAASSTARQPGQLNLNVGPGRSASLVYGGIRCLFSQFSTWIQKNPL